MRPRNDRSRKQFVTMAVVSLAFHLALIGCGSSNPQTHAVHGRVTFEGKPLAGGGSIRFVPVSGPGKEAGGNIAADGTFRMQTYKENDGAIAGQHRVEIVQNQIVKAAVYPEVKPTTDKEPGPVEPISPEVRISAQEEIPAVYGGPQSPLKATVESAKPEINFDLKRNP